MWDAAVIGGGPAGCSAAIRMAQEGFKVILFEARDYPHDKMCGEFLSPECAGLLDALGMTARVDDLAPVSIHTTRLTSPDGALWEAPLPGRALGLSRRVLDAALAEQAEAAGVQVCPSTTVRGLSGSLERGFTLQTGGRGGTSAAEARARAVIAAHGKRAPLDRAMKRKFLDARQPFVAVKAHFHGPPVPGRVELHAFPGGYCGISDIEGGNQVLCFLAREQVFHPRVGGGQTIDDFTAWMGAQNPRLGAWLGQAERIHARWISIAQVPFVAKPAMEGDALMAGDAAGLIVPLAGNGISMALEGGMLAAALMAQWLSGALPSEGLRQAYPAAWKARFGRRLRLGRALQPLMLEPRYAALALRLLNRLPALGRALIAGTRGAGGAHDLKETA